MNDINWLGYELDDPVATSKRIGEGFAKAKHELEKDGIKGFLFGASSVEEFDERLKYQEVPQAIEKAASKYLVDVSDAPAKLTRTLRREFEAPVKMPDVVDPKQKGRVADAGWDKYVEENYDAEGNRITPFREVSCTQCGTPMNPAQAAMGPVCGQCARDNQRKVTSADKIAKSCECKCEKGGDCSCGKKCGKSCDCKCTRTKK